MVHHHHGVLDEGGIGESRRRLHLAHGPARSREGRAVGGVLLNGQLDVHRDTVDVRDDAAVEVSGGTADERDGG